MDRSFYASVGAGAESALNKFLIGVYNRMFFGLVLTAIAAFVCASVPMIRDVLYYSTPTGGLPLTLVGFAAAFAPLLLILFIPKRTSKGAAFLFWSVATIFGVSLSSVLLQYTGASVTYTFLSTAVAFAGLSIYGLTTGRNLSAMGAFLVMALVGLLGVMLLNLFLNLEFLDTAVAGAGVLIFVGLTAYDSQRLKTEWNELQGSLKRHDGDERALQYSGALSLYLDFINLFLFLLRFIGVTVKK